MRARAERNAERTLFAPIDYRKVLPVMGRMSGADLSEIVRRALEKNAGPADRTVTPHTPWHYDKYPEPLKVAVPPLLRAYLKRGAKVLGEPSYDPEFNTADLYILLDMQAMDPRIIKRFTGE